MKVKVYFVTNGTYYFPARDRRNAREIAGRIVREGCWIINDDGTEEMYPPDKVFKVKILPDEHVEPKES
jgi:hypothetical protein